MCSFYFELSIHLSKEMFGFVDSTHNKTEAIRKIKSNVKLGLELSFFVKKYFSQKKSEKNIFYEIWNTGIEPQTA